MPADTPWWKHPIVHAAGVAVAGTASFFLFDLLDKLPNALAEVSKFLLAPDLSDSGASLAITPVGRVTVCMVYALAVLGLMAVVYVVRRRAERVRAESVRLFFAPIKELYTLLLQMGLEREISDYQREISIRPNWDVEVRDRLSIAAANRVLPAFEVHYSSEIPETSLERAELSAVVLTGNRKVIAVLAERSLLHRRYVLMFVPPIEPGHPASQIEFTYRWSKAAKMLASVGETDRYTYVMPPGLPAPLDSLRLIVGVDAAGEFEFRHVFPAVAATIKDEVKLPRRYELTLEHVAPGTDVSIEVYRKA